MIAGMYVSRFRDYIYKLFDTQNNYALDRVNDYVQPVINFPDDASHALLRGEMLYGHGQDIAAVVGNRGLSALALVGISDVIAIVDEIIVTASVAMDIGISLVSGVNFVAETNPALPCDFRNVGDTFTGKVKAVCQVGQASVAAAAVTSLFVYWHRVDPTSALVIRPTNLVLTPNFGAAGEAGAPANSAITVEAVANNLQFHVSYRWRERSGTQRELNFVQK